MPELPEVEVVRATLEQALVGKTITKVDCFYEPIIENIDEFMGHVLHQKIVKIGRYAKYLIFYLDDGCILSHLRMEGKYYIQKEEEKLLKYVHVVFHLDDGTKLSYADMRKFGRMVFKKEQELFTTPPLSKLGVEANSSLIDSNVLYEKIHLKHLPIKTLLLDQTMISGLGNIYADEVLFYAHILPMRNASSITKEELESILEGSRMILNEAILKKGCTIRSYTSSLGVKGSYQEKLCVHTKTNCLCCNESILKIKIGGRTSYYCKHCQR